jgi:hypothetical protein
MTDPAHRDAMEPRRTPYTEREAVDALCDDLTSTTMSREEFYRRADKMCIESAAMLRALLARAEAAERAEKDWIKIANDLTTHLENAETALTPSPPRHPPKPW